MAFLVLIGTAGAHFKDIDYRFRSNLKSEVCPIKPHDGYDMGFEAINNGISRFIHALHHASQQHIMMNTKRTTVPTCHLETK